ncbi:hypothetical protein [Luteipulveratus halotolerans]|uniref:hypothetical protein n=1 Tax=Luteipulveratus halotolerans TaxID=1631356 RepID=UPI0012F7A4FE|nr:hypothetical protein [Luteipulveratus halotolerans]
MIGYTPDLAGTGGEEKVVATIAFVGPRGAPMASLTPAVGNGSSSALIAIAHRPTSRPGDLLVLGPDGQVPTRVSAGPIYHLDGTATRTWTPLRFDHGVATASLPATGPDSTVVRAETGESVMATTAWVTPPGGPGTPAPVGDVATDLVRQFASDQRLAPSQVTVLDRRTTHYRAPAQRPFPFPAPGQNRIPGPSPTMLEVGWTATTVVMQRPDGTVFRSGRVEPDNNRGNSTTQSVTGAPTDARRWRGRPMVATEESETGSRQPVVLIAPGAARVRFTGQNGGQVSLDRIGDGVFRGQLAATGWFTDPMRVTVETYDGNGRRLGRWPLLTAAEADPLVQGGTTGMVTRTY